MHWKIPFKFSEYGGGGLLNTLPLWGYFAGKKKGGDSEGDQISDKLFGVFFYIFVGVSVYLWCTCLWMCACVQHACVHANCILAHTHKID